MAKAVLEGKTKGYTTHLQLLRFRKQDRPLDAINVYFRRFFKKRKGAATGLTRTKST